MWSELSATPDPGVCLRPLEPFTDAPLLHDWFQQPYAAFWGMQDHALEQVRAYYAGLQASGHASAWLGLVEGRAAFVMECYDPVHDEVGRHYNPEPGDRGMHFLVAPPVVPRAGFTRRVLRAILHFMFEQLGARRVVVEPDARNTKVHVLNEAMGFVHERVIAMPHKRARLGFCTPYQFHLATSKDTTDMSTRHPHPARLSAHLTPEAWSAANRHLVCKAIAEFSHEQLLEPTLRGPSERAGWQRYELLADTLETLYSFDAQPMALRHWRIDGASIRRSQSGEVLALDAQRFILDFRQTLGLRPEMLPVYLEEISSTLHGFAFKRAKGNPSSSELADADFQTIESSMTEGHPGFVANNGRLGFDAQDVRAYAPESGGRFPVVWLAVHQGCATFACAADLTHDQLISQEVGAGRLGEFREQLSREGLDPTQYVFMPAHPWQWANKLCVGFADELAQRRIVCMGHSDDLYQAQQSIRTFFNVSAPHKCYVKTSLSILNMGFMRGLSPHYMAGTPAINDWVRALVEGDATLRTLGFSVLREVASVGYRRPVIEAAIEGDSPHKKMLSALWRESPVDRVAPHERLMSMTALLHVDDAGRALLPELIRRSGLPTALWLRQYLRAYLTPLLHCFYAHDLVFMPHGENLIMVLDAHVPVRVLMKDIAEECAVLDPSARDRLPPAVQRIAVDVPDDFKLLGIFIDVFDGFFRHLAQALVEGDCCAEDEFWMRVAECVLDYQEGHPQWRDKFARHDIFAPSFRHSCLNRLQLGNNTQMLNLADPAAGLKMAEDLPNPLRRIRGR